MVVKISLTSCVQTIIFVKLSPNVRRGEYTTLTELQKEAEQWLTRTK